MAFPRPTRRLVASWRAERRTFRQGVVELALPKRVAAPDADPISEGNDG